MTDKQLRVWWVPQIPGPSFYAPVKSPEQAAFLLDSLAKYDLFQLEENIKPDYSNAGGLQVFEDGEWLDWEDDFGRDIDSWTAHVGLSQNGCNCHKLKEAEEKIKSYEESLELCLDSRSPLSDMGKDVVKGFFIGLVKKDKQ